MNTYVVMLAKRDLFAVKSPHNSQEALLLFHVIYPNMYMYMSYMYMSYMYMSYMYMSYMYMSYMYMSYMYMYMSFVMHFHLMCRSANGAAAAKLKGCTEVSFSVCLKIPRNKEIFVSVFVF